MITQYMTIKLQMPTPRGSRGRLLMDAVAETLRREGYTDAWVIRMGYAPATAQDLEDTTRLE
jgi:hypothetical protein